MTAAPDELLALRREIEELRARERELTDFIENAVEGLHWVGHDGTILWANQAELDFLGYQRDEYIGHNIAEFHADPEAIEDILARLTADEKLYNRPARMRAKDGSIKHVLIHSSVYREDGRFVHTRCFTRDVTEIVRREHRIAALHTLTAELSAAITCAEVEAVIARHPLPSDDTLLAVEIAKVCAQARERARRFEAERAGREHAEAEARARQELLSIVSHDLRNPLGSILTGVGLLKKLDIGEEKAAKLMKYADIIQRSAERMNKWMAELLELAAIEAGQAPIRRAAHDPAVLVKESVDMFAPIAAEKQVALEWKLDGGRPIVVDRERILQVLSNLVSNAIKFTPSGGRVLVGVQGTDGDTTFSVADTGPGIPDEQRPKIFDRYWQARRQRGAGVGLGLSIAKGLVEAHGGRIWVESRDGGGACFKFTVPAE